MASCCTPRDATPRRWRSTARSSRSIHAARKLIDSQPDATGPLTDAERALLAAGDRFLMMFPDDPLAQSVTYQTAWLLYSRDQLDEAAVRFRRVIAMDPSTADAIRGANFLCDSLALAGQWALLQETALEFHELDGLGDSAFKADIWNIYQRASFKRIEAKLAEDGDGVAAAEAWMAFAAEHPTAEIADLALNNAAVHFHRAGLIRSAMAAQEALLAGHPTSRYVPDQLAALGFNCETIADFGAAARWYEALHAASPEHPSVPDALYSAAVFRRTLGELDAALADTRALAGLQDARVAGLLMDIGQAYQEAGRWTEAAALYRDFATSPPTHATAEQHTYARLAWASAAVELDRHAEAEAVWQALIDDGATGEALAEATYSLLTPTSRAYAAMRIDGVQRAGQPRDFDQRLQRQLKDKVAALQALEADYAAVIETGSLRWGLAALVEVGRSYEDLADALRQSPAPTGLTPEQLEMYRERIDDLAWMQEQRAIEAYGLVMDRSIQVRSYDESTAVALGRLESLAPEAWPGLSEDLIRAGFTTGSGYGVGIMDQPE
jgi:tetratricopeptide (TPR) repeat protein